MLRVKEWLKIRRGATDEILCKWKDTGMLYGVDSSHARILAKLYEDISQVALGITFKHPDTYNIILPIARSCYLSYNHYIRNIPKFCKYVDDNLFIRKNLIDGIKAYEANTGEIYNREEKIESARQRGRTDLPDDYIGIDIQSEVAFRISYEVAEQKI